MLGPINLDTPDRTITKISLRDGSGLKLVFYDGFNNDGRTLYSGEDPSWEAIDHRSPELHNSDAITGKGRALQTSLSLSKETRDLNHRGGVMNSWNQFLFTGGYIEAAVGLPGFDGAAEL